MDAPDADSYRVFWPLLKPVIGVYHRVQGVEVSHVSQSGWPDAEELEGIVKGEDKVTRVHMEVRRNLAGLSMQPKMGPDDYASLEKMVRAACEMKMERDFTGNYYELRGLSSKIRDDLDKLGEIFANDDRLLRSAGAYKHWPQGRAIFASHSRRQHIWINQSDHFRIRAVADQGKGDGSKVDKFHSAYVELTGVLKAFERALKDDKKGDIFARDDKLGFLTLSPAHLGTGLTVRVRLTLSRVDLEAARETLDDEEGEGLEVEQITSENRNFLEISNRWCFGRTEKQILTKVSAGVNAVLRADDPS